MRCAQNSGYTQSQARRCHWHCGVRVPRVSDTVESKKISVIYQGFPSNLKSQFHKIFATVFWRFEPKYSRFKIKIHGLKHFYVEVQAWEVIDWQLLMLKSVLTPGVSDCGTVPTSPESGSAVSLTPWSFSWHLEAIAVCCHYFRLPSFFFFLRETGSPSIKSIHWNMTILEQKNSSWKVF